MSVDYEGGTSTREDNVKFTKEGCLVNISVNGSLMTDYFSGDDAKTQRVTYEMIYSALLDSFGKFTYDASLNKYVASAEITVNYAVSISEKTVNETVFRAIQR